MAETTEPTAAEVATLLRDYDALLEAAGGWVHRIPADELEAWQDRKVALLARILEHQGGDR